MRSVVSLAVLALLAGSALSQTYEIPGVKVTTPPTIDGIISPEEWSAITPMKGGYDEQTGAPIPVETEYWMTYDEKFIYFAARAEDKDPGSIRAHEYRSNVSLQGDDYVGIFIDPFGTLSDNNNQFEINPRGATNLRIAGGRAAKREWLGEILAKGTITETGYEVEARIPWALMRLPSAGKRDLRVGFYRIVAKEGRAYLVTDVSGNRNERIPYWRNVMIPAVVTERVVKLLPYTYLGYDKDKGGAVFNSGLDFKTQTSTGLDIVGSINPDFRNIENQVLSIDFSYFERLAGESRPFFLEGSQYFRTSGDAPLFASQRIQNFDVGLKAFGKLSDQTTVAALDAADFGKRNDFVGVLRHSFSTTSNLTVAAANQTLKSDPTLGNNNNLGSFIGYGKSFGRVEAFGQYMTTEDTRVGSGHRTNTGLVYNNAGMSGWLEYTEISPNFIPRLGFAPERNFRGFSGGAEYGRTLPIGKLMEYEASIFVQDLDNYSGGGKYKRQINMSTAATLRNNIAFGGGAFFREFRNFKDRLYSVFLLNPRNNPYRGWSLEYQFGNLAGRNYTSAEAGFKYRPYKNFQITASYQAVRHFTNDNQAIVSGNYDINAFDSVSGRMIQRGGDINLYLAYRRTGNSGNEYFLILGDPNSRTFRPSIIAKAVFPMNLRF